ncbi:FAD/NAD-P-binding domain-containing protein [Epithele typhae]|uniref:FAD/NAD-P-binding domain-containing protein n=1 Tax=Epithele typhae TaxID=378194 RepID=UPI002008DE32|nr:FAD/NAD-P-binding domain-containing protein [Epithele typhae]KAH9933558.1 FAD/NAD-P-binding domain-containing protein [Epithele typhae]
MPHSTSQAPLRTQLPIDFVIVGGGLAGLSCALALRRVGHRVTVLERGQRGAIRGEGGLRLPPNVSKIFFQWGLREALEKASHTSHTIWFSIYESGERLGEQVWSQEVLKETRGVFLVTTHAELHDFLHEAATAAGADIRYGAAVSEVDTETRIVQLSSGESLVGDVIVGADGEFGICRTAVVGQKTPGTVTGLAMYDTLISRKHLPDGPLDKVRAENGSIVAFGDNRAIIGYPVHGGEDFAIQLYGPDDAQEGNYGDEPSVDVSQIASTSQPRLREVLKYARKATRVTVRDHSDLEDWVDDEGRLILVGEAAHPFPPGTIQATAMAVEDGAVLAKLFAHLSEARQIESFLYAFQELRQERTRSVRASEFGNAFFMAMPECDVSRGRDAMMRQLGEAGLNVLEGGDGEASGAWDQVRTIFGYDCEDEADDWWVHWGLLRERALDGRGCEAPVSAFAGFSMHVSEKAATASESGESDRVL